MNQRHPEPIIGRFAPSPTGPLHLGSLFTAVASFCAAKSAGGRWLVRIEDTDHERCRDEHTFVILKTLEAFGLHWDGSVRIQSDHLPEYHQKVAQMLDDDVAYACQCTRKSLRQYRLKHPDIETYAYPGLCRSRNLPIDDHNIRAVIEDKNLIFYDLLQGEQRHNPSQTLGDTIIRRRNQIINYILSSVVDDAEQGVNQIVRGIDLLSITPSQLAIANQLSLLKGFVERTGFAHLPVLKNPNGQKLSKQNLATPVNTKAPADTLMQVLSMLKQPPVDRGSPTEMLKQASAQWRFETLNGLQSIVVDYH